jgi:hypothetical protein
MLKAAHDLLGPRGRPHAIEARENAVSAKGLLDLVERVPVPRREPWLA